ATPSPLTTASPSQASNWTLISSKMDTPRLRYSGRNPGVSYAPARARLSAALPPNAAGRYTVGMTAHPTNTVLDKIVASKRREIAAAWERLPEPELEARLAGAPPTRDFRAALERPGGIQVIAEVKKASPSAGVLRPDFDPVAIARTYAAHGAACVSVLTDAPFFQGHLEYLAAIRPAVAVPLLRK